MPVTNLNASGPGSLEACIQLSGPRTCVFEVSGVIWRTSDLEIKNSYITIAGQTAPPPGISIFGAGLVIRADDVLVQHLRIRVGDLPDGEPVHNRDALSIKNSFDPPHRVIVDHLSAAFSSDEAASVWYDAGDVSIINSIIGWALDDSIHIDEGQSQTAPHGYGPLFGEFDGRIYFGKNYLSHFVRRSPRVLTPQFVMVNNAIHNYKEIGTQIRNDDLTSNNTVVGNYYSTGVDTKVTHPIRIETYSQSKVFLYGNMLDGNLPSSQFDIVSLGRDESRVTSVPPDLFPTFFPARDVPAHVQSNAGAWPAYRDAVDVALVDHLLTGGGEIINCVEDDGSSRCSKNGGGWPTIPENRHRLNIPAKPMGDDNGDGYTNLENWLHTLDQWAQTGG